MTDSPSAPVRKRANRRLACLEACSWRPAMNTAVAPNPASAAFVGVGRNPPSSAISRSLIPSRASSVAVSATACSRSGCIWCEAGSMNPSSGTSAQPGEVTGHAKRGRACAIGGRLIEGLVWGACWVNRRVAESARARCCRDERWLEAPGVYAADSPGSRMDRASARGR